MKPAGSESCPTARRRVDEYPDRPDGCGTRPTASSSRLAISSCPEPVRAGLHTAIVPDVSHAAGAWGSMVSGSISDDLAEGRVGGRYGPRRRQPGASAVTGGRRWATIRPGRYRKPPWKAYCKAWCLLVRVETGRRSRPRSKLRGAGPGYPWWLWNQPLPCRGGARRIVPRRRVGHGQPCWGRY